MCESYTPTKKANVQEWLALVWNGTYYHKQRYMPKKEFYLELFHNVCT